MRIAVVGATGRIGTKLTRTLLDAGHQVRALSRGGPALDALIELGAEPCIGSFDAGTGSLDHFFHEADAAFLMVKTDWGNIHGHYSEVALRFFDALRDAPVKRVVNLTAMGSGVRGSTGHFQPFHQLDEILNRLRSMDIVHLRAGWFMENLFGWTESIAKYGRIAWSMEPDARSPWVAIDDVAGLAARELTGPRGEHRSARDLGADYAMSEVVAAIGREIGQPVEYRFVDMKRTEVETAFRNRFGTLERWLDDMQTMDALNDRRVRFRDDRPSLPTPMQAFVRDTWKPRYFEALAAERQEPETFLTWNARDETGSNHAG